MTLFAAEMRKIWRPLPVLILIAMGALWTFVGILPAFDDYTATDRVAWTALNLSSERRLIDRYGPLTDKSTIDKMKADIPRLEKQVTRDIQMHPTEAKTLGISDFAGYERWHDSIASGTFYPTGAPNTITDGRTSTGASTAESAAIDAAKRAKDPTEHMTEEQQRAVGEADRVITQDSEALQDLYNISLLMRHFPITQADAQHNLTNSVEMLRSTASTDHPITALQKQFEHDYRAEAENGWSAAISGGCATTDITGKTVTNETDGESNGNGGTGTGDAANGANGSDGNSKSGTADDNGTNDNGSSASGTGDAGAVDASGSESANDSSNGDGTADYAQLGTGCDPNDASLGSQSYRVPGTMPKAVTERLARYAADPGRSSYIQYNVVEKTWTYAAMVAVFSVIASAAMTVPVMVRDRGRRMTQLQWASRSGRAGQHARVAATASSSLIIGLVSLAVFGIPLAVMLRDFLAVPVLNLNSNVSVAGISLESLFGAPIVPWAYWTFGQYLAIISATVLVLTLAITMVGAWLCRSMRSIIRMLLVMVPLLSLVLLPSRFIYFQNMFLMGNWFTNRLTVPGLEAWMPLGVLALSAAAWMFSTFRLGRRELLMS
ncbi:hypothetical protein [Bifidobacterium sp. SO4]|uniref:hypothetical protein n=1 Tax=Bifidobacterium sp. SO4 TaxID=2809030 RepID=UPI001BDCBA3A|nr:hypothetical protein [Bifidobacterium sp. SO4]MBT1170525.1 hypothetical protein [Bifidobacterium sp. SO4]